MYHNELGASQIGHIIREIYIHRQSGYIARIISMYKIESSLIFGVSPLSFNNCSYPSRHRSGKRV